MRQRLQKLMAKSGIASRRKSEAMIEAGRVRINGETAHLGQRADWSQDAIMVDGKPLTPPQRPVVIALNKPPGVLSSLRSQGGKPRVIDLIDSDTRVYPVGRLDLESEGLLLLTNDGELAQRLTHPSFQHNKRYRVLLDAPLTPAQQKAWQNGPTVLELGKLQPCELTVETDPRWIRLVLKEGKKRQIRRTARHFGRAVTRLIRLQMGPIALGNLASGEWRQLTEHEHDRLRRQLGLDKAEVNNT